MPGDATDPAATYGLLKSDGPGGSGHGLSVGGLVAPTHPDSELHGHRGRALDREEREFGIDDLHVDLGQVGLLKVGNPPGGSTH